MRSLYAPPKLNDEGIIHVQLPHQRDPFGSLTGIYSFRAIVQNDRVLNVCLVATHLTPHCCHMGTAIKHHVPDRVKPSFVIFDTRALTLRAERQSARMSKITNDGLTRSGL